MYSNIRFTVAFVLIATAIFIWSVNVAEPQEFVTEGLVSFWTFDQADIAGNTLKDVWGKNNGIIEGEPIVVEGKIEEALEFDGVDDRVEVPHDPSIDFPGMPFSIELWFKGNPGTIADDHRIFCKGFGGGHGKRYEFEMEDGVSFILDDNATKTKLTYPEGSTDISDEKWHHWALVRDMDKGMVRIYLDGEEVAAGNDDTGDDISNENSLWFTSQDPDDPTGTPGRRVPGIMDEFRIYNRALSEQEVQKNYGVLSNRTSVDAAGKLAALWAQLKTSW